MRFKALTLIVSVSFVISCKSEKTAEIINPGGEDSHYLSLLRPNGGESIIGGSDCAIKWTGNCNSSMKISYSLDNGTNWNLIKDSIPNSGLYEWQQVPNQSSDLCKIMISSLDGSVSDQSDSPFRIMKNNNQTLEIITPNGGECLVSGTSDSIKWISKNIEYVKIQYSTNAGADWLTIVGSTPSDGCYLWENIPLHKSSICKIKILDARDDIPSAESESFFTITDKVPKSIEIETPNGGEVYFSNIILEIKWSSVNISFVTIEYSSNNGISWERIAEKIPNTEKFNWTLPGIQSNQCKIRIFDSDDSSISDQSDGIFTIKDPPRIYLVYPNGNEVFAAGDSLSIIWNTNGVENVNIQYSNSFSGQERLWIDIIKNKRNNGNYRTVLNEVSDNYKIRVSDSRDGTVSDESDSTFSVVIRNTPNSTVGGKMMQNLKLRNKANVILRKANATLQKQK